MPSDPVVYTDKVEPGKMKHSLTGMRPSFPNLNIHRIILDIYCPARKEIFKRPEFGHDGRWPATLVTLYKESLTEFSNRIKTSTFIDDSPQSKKTLADSVKEREAFIAKANDKGTSLEDLARESSATHADRKVLPANQRISAIQFDFTGNDADYPQPTPGRLPNSHAREFVIGVDMLIVEMTNSASAEHPLTINKDDASAFQVYLAELFMLVENAGLLTRPYYPTNINRSGLDSTFNADGKLDPALNDGAGQFGDPQGENPTEVANA